MDNLNNFDLVIESMQERLYGKDAYMAGKIDALKEQVDNQEIGLKIAWGVVLPRLVKECENRLGVKTGTYDQFGGGA